MGSIGRRARACASLWPLGLTVFAFLANFGRPLAVASATPAVAVLGAPGDSTWNTDVQEKLIGTGALGSVDVIDIRSSTPILSQLQSYCSVLVYTDAPAQDPTALGNVLADYVDSGGGVVAAMFATGSLPVAGRFNTDDYWVIQPSGQQQDTPEGLGAIYDPSHPILAGVTSFNGGSSSYRPSRSNVHPLATRIADWTGPGTIPLVAVRTIGAVRRADLGFYPPSGDVRADFWVPTTDGARLMANALTWTCGGLLCGNGVVDAGEQCDDGNQLNGDGCDSSCRTEPCYSCAGQPSTCSTIPDGSSCDDHHFCNGADTCLGGACAVHTGDPCAGGLECDNVCNEAGKNCALPAGTACAEDDNHCTTDECDGQGSCVHQPEYFTPCDDGVFCNGADECYAGTCQFHDGDPCAGNECAPTCDEAVQACAPLALGTPCTDDGLPCTNDQCDGTGFCSHPPTAGGTPCPADGNICTIDECNGIGLCTHPPAPDGTACNDANACTQTDQCQSGQCVGSDPVICPSPTCYLPGTCDPSTGTCTNCPTGYTQGHGGCERHYAIGASLLDDLPFTCGVTRYTCNTAFGFGFHWTDAADDAVGEVTRVDIEFQPGEDCFEPQHTVSLNDVPIGTYAPTAATTCGCFPSNAPEVLANVDPTAYVKGADNAVAITTSSCAGIGQDASSNYAVVTVTYADPGLAPGLRTGCRTAAKSRFGYKNKASDAQDKLLWTWGKGAATSRIDFGDPTLSAAYQLCVFRETSGRPGLLFSGEVPPSATAWRAMQAGFTYEDSAGGHDGIRFMRLRDGAAGKSKLSVSGQGANLSDPALPLPLDTVGIRVQLTNESSDTCWESEFPLSRITADDKRIRATVH